MWSFGKYEKITPTISKQKFPVGAEHLDTGICIKFPKNTAEAVSWCPKKYPLYIYLYAFNYRFKKRISLKYR